MNNLDPTPVEAAVHFLKRAHRDALAMSRLVTLGPWAYPVTLPIAAVLLGAVWILDPEEIERE